MKWSAISLGVLLLSAGGAHADELVCGPPPSCPQALPEGRRASPGARPVEVWAWCDLPPGDKRSHGLSGLAYDPEARALLAVRDHPTEIVTLVPDAGFRSFTFGGPALQVALRDTEGIAIASDGLLISDERKPGIFHIGRDGTMGGKLPLPARFDRTRENMGIEALATTPDRTHVVFATEQALSSDGPPSGGGVPTTVRIGRLDLTTGKTREVAYLTEAVTAPGIIGISDVMMLSERVALVTERSYVARRGNSVRTYRVDLDSSPDVSGLSSLSADTPVLEKQLVVDLTGLSDCGVPRRPEPQANRLLANYEGFALGPELRDGRRLIFAISDNNDDVNQVARLLVLAVRNLQ